MCDCVTNFQRQTPSLALPLDPSAVLCFAPPKLLTEFDAITVQWNSYIQKLLVAVIQHTAPLPPTETMADIVGLTKAGHSKKKRRRPMSPNTRRRAIDLLSAGRNVSEIAEQLKVPPRSVSDLKYAIGKRSTDQEAGSGQ